MAERFGQFVVMFPLMAGKAGFGTNHCLAFPGHYVGPFLLSPLLINTLN